MKEFKNIEGKIFPQLSETEIAMVESYRSKTTLKNKVVALAFGKAWDTSDMPFYGSQAGRLSRELAPSFYYDLRDCDVVIYLDNVPVDGYGDIAVNPPTEQKTDRENVPNVDGYGDIAVNPPEQKTDREVGKCPLCGFTDALYDFEGEGICYTCLSGMAE